MPYGMTVYNFQKIDFFKQSDEAFVVVKLIGEMSYFAFSILRYFVFPKFYCCQPTVAKYFIYQNWDHILIFTANSSCKRSKILMRK